MVPYVFRLKEVKNSLNFLNIKKKLSTGTDGTDTIFV